MSHRLDGRHAGAVLRRTRALMAWALLLMSSPSAGIAQENGEPFARVIVESAVVRAGPGSSFRKVYLAERGEVFPVLSRGTAGYWFRVQLPDSTYGWVAGDAVHPHELGADEARGDRFLPWLFAPPPLAGASGEVAISGGVLGGGGMFALRPSLLLDPAFGLECNALSAVGAEGRVWMATLGPLVNLVPRSPIVPFATVQAGIAASQPNADSFLLDSGTIATMNAGVGLRIGFHYRLTLRLEARAHVFFEPDRTVSQEEFSAGLTVMF
jgi:hypothetical protein